MPSVNLTIALSRWRERAIDDPVLQEELSKLDPDDSTALFDRFGSSLAFGTGGLRGLIGAGTNRMNIYTVRQAAQGLCADIIESGLPLSLAIAFDSRINSGLFALETARVAAGNGLDAYLYPRLEPTPALSFAVRRLCCGAGVCITASHNPRAYNGFKVYGPDGCQITLNAASRVANRIAAVDPFDGVRLAAKNDSHIHAIDDACLNAYLDAVMALDPAPAESNADLSVVYTPLNGAGRECMELLFHRANVKKYAIVPEQAEPDGTFPTCPYPNPEEKSAMALALALAVKEKPDLVIGTDPDCDRMAAAVPDSDGSYRLLTGNETAALMLDYVCRARIAAQTMPKHPIAVTTVVTTDFLTPIAEKYGVELRRTLTGFKFIGEQIGLLEAAGEKDRFIFGCEESYGYLTGTHARDKDAVNASLVLLSMAQDAARRGTSLLDDLAALGREHGFYLDALSSFACPGVNGMAVMADVMDHLRLDPPTEIDGLTVTATIDYRNTKVSHLPAADVLEFRLLGGCRLTVRPSGTEPKIKLYLSARAATLSEANARIKTLSAAAASLVGFPKA